MINARESKANVLLSLLIILYKSVRLYINGNYEYHLVDKVEILRRKTILRICVKPANQHLVSTVMALKSVKKNHLFVALMPVVEERFVSKYKYFRPKMKKLKMIISSTGLPSFQASPDLSAAGSDLDLRRSWN